MSSETALAGLLSSHLPLELLATVLLDVCARLREATLGGRRETSLARLAIATLKTRSLQTLSPEMRECETETLDCLMRYVFSNIRQASGDVSQLRTTIELCGEDRRVHSGVVFKCAESLALALWSVLEEEQGWAFSEPDMSSRVTSITRCLSSNSPGEGSQLPIDPRHRPDESLTVLESMSFVHSSAVMNGSLHPLTFHLASYLLLLIQASSQDLLNKSRDALLAILAPDSRILDAETMQGARTVPEWFREILWQTIYVLTSLNAGTDRKTAGYAIWSRILVKPELPPPGDALHGEDYWQILWTGISQGTSEHRKYALTILRGSLDRIDRDMNLPSMTFKIADANRTKAEYAKYATVFDTIVLGRYLNQVQAALPELSIIASPQCLVNKSWVLALLHGALLNGMQDSIRRVIGSWIFECGSSILLAAPHVTAFFLEDALLPWATLGYHYTSSIQSDEKHGVICAHGEQMSDFLARTIEASSEPSLVIESVLKFLISQGGRMFSYGRAYALDGVLRGMIAAKVELSGDDLPYVIQIATGYGFQEMVQDLMTMQCSRIAALLPAHLQSSPKLQSLRRAAAAIEATLKDKHDEEMSFHGRSPIMSTLEAETEPEATTSLMQQASTVADLALIVVKTQCQCFWRSGLEAGAHCLRRALNSKSDETLNPGDLATTIEALWDECQVQDYPRSVIRILPPLFFHAKAVRLLQPGSELTTLLKRTLSELAKLAETRFYVFAPLAEVLRKVCVTERQAVHLPIAQYLTQYANHPPHTRVEFELEKAVGSRLAQLVPSRTFEAYYGKDASYGHACIFDMLNTIPQSAEWTMECRLVLDTILKQWLEQKQPVPVFSRWKTTAQLQIMLLCIERVLSSLNVDEVDTYSNQLFDILALEPLPRLRYLLEWIVFRILARLPDGRLPLLTGQGVMSLDNPKYLVSIMKINLMLACLPDSTEDFALELITQLIGFAGSPKIVVRHEAQWMFTPLWDHACQKRWDSIINNPAFQHLDETIRMLPTYKTPPLARLLERFHPIKDHNLTHLLSGDYLRIEPGEAQRTSHRDLMAVLASDEALYKLEKDALIPVGEAYPIQTDPALTARESTLDLDAPMLKDQPGASIPLQIKSSAWQDDLNGLTGASTSQRRTRQVIVVASFIDNAFNIGGLSRLGEIFGIESLQVCNIKTLKNKDFTSVSVSSHLWLSIEQLEAEKVSRYLIDRKIEGYSIVGIEQTDSSKVLGTKDCLLPEKIVLVLGSEREGIPASTLADLDSCVEIRQIGVTRSMNVQTAAAVVLYEYSRQHTV